MLPRESLLDMFYRMHLTRAFNDRFMELKAAGKIFGPIHRSTGQEAIGIGIGTLLRDDDYVISNHRGYAHWIGKRVDLNRLSAEIFGKQDGFCKGKAGEMLIADLSKNVMSTTIIGGGLPLAVGLGMSAKMRGTDQIVVCFFGDGAANEGAFHESLNFAALQRVPVMFVCENNAWALSVHVRRSTSVRDIARRAIGYDIPGHVVDGNDILDICDLTEQLIIDLRAGRGPVLVEAKTYRLGSFSSNDRVSGYQPAEEIARWRAKDPIRRFHDQLLELQVASTTELRELEERAGREADAAVAYGEAAAYPALSELHEDVFAAAE